MTPELAATLAGLSNDPAARRELMRRRAGELPLDERREVAEALERKGAHRAAALWWLGACRQAPGDDRLAYRLGNSLRRVGHPRAAARVLEQLCRRHPDWAEPAQSLAWLRRLGGDSDAAADTLETWVAAVGVERKAVGATAAFLRDMGLTARAEKLLAQAGDDPGLQAERGDLLLKLGRFDEAETVLRKVVADAPAQAGAWLRLAQVRRWDDAAASPREIMRAGLQQPQLDEATRAAIGFALAKVEDDLEDYAAAWHTLATANPLRARSAHFDREAWRAYELKLYETFTPELIARFAQAAADAPAPLFIVGMPRSGTTLLERRLGRHSALFAGGELELIEQLGIEAAGDKGYPAGLASITTEIRDATLRQWQSRRPGAGDGELIDKNPLNFFHLGWIVCLFPRVRIIHCRRGPLDTAMSLWFQNFAHPKNDYAYRFEDIAWMYALYLRVMKHWAALLPKQIHAVDYARVVSEPERELRDLVAWLGLDWESVILEEKDDGVIATASLWQARQPIYRSSLDRARHYRRWIEPLSAALRAEGILPETA